MSMSALLPTAERDDPRTWSLLALIQQTVAELQRRPEGAVRVALDSALDRDLGLDLGPDSLGRVELLLRIERTFGVMLPENTLQIAQTPRDLLAALDAAQRHAASAPRTQQRLVSVPPAALETEPTEAVTLLETLDWHAERHGAPRGARQIPRSR